MSFVAKNSDVITEQCVLSSYPVEVQPAKSRSSVATNATFQSVDQCSMVPTVHSLHTLAQKCPPSPSTTDAHDEATSTDLSDEESHVRLSSCDADTLLADGSSFSDCESASFLGASSQGACSDGEAADEEAVSCVYSVMLLLQLRAGALRRSGPCPVKYGTQRVGELASAAPAEERKKFQAKSFPSSERAVQTPTRNSFAAAAANRSDDEKVARAARSILNKLTVEKFDALHEKLATCGVKTPEQLALLMREIFEKATEQHHFIAMYADLCVRLEADARLAPAAGERDGFRRMLLGQCQTAFEKLFEEAPVPASTEQDADLEELGARRKRRALGNVKLVGHLLVRGMLSSRLLVECADALLASRASCPEALESLAALLTVAGPKFDHKDWRSKDRLDAVFQVVAVLTKDKAVPTRVRFLLQDLLDLRRARWQAAGGPAAGPQGPMRLEEVKRQAQRCGQEPAASAGRKQLPTRRFTETPKSLEAVTATRTAKAASFSHSIAAATPKSAGTLQKVPSPTSSVIAKPTVGVSAATAATSAAVATATTPTPFSLKDFHRELSSTLRDLGADLNVVAAVRRVRAQNVPLCHHSGEFVDIITRAAEEKRGPARRSMFAFAAGLLAAEHSAFDRSRCLEGVGIFFREVYEELCLEVPRLQQIVSAELLPALKSVACARDLAAAVPEELRAAL